jgi:hypothetical protein
MQLPGECFKVRLPKQEASRVTFTLLHYEHARCFTDEFIFMVL